MNANYIINYQNVSITHHDLEILKNVTLKVKEGDFIYLIGKVGTGKSSLMKTFYNEMKIKGGEAFIFDYNLNKLKTKQIPTLRRKLGIVFQDFQLLTDRTVYKNLEFVLRATRWTSKQAIETRINEVLQLVDMNRKSYRMPHELSGGEQQRIVIARALLNTPDLILADEPTGNLDPHTGKEIVELLQTINKEQGTTIIMSTHNLQIVKLFPATTYLCRKNQLFLHTSDENDSNKEFDLENSLE